MILAVLLSLFWGMLSTVWCSSPPDITFLTRQTSSVSEDPSASLLNFRGGVKRGSNDHRYPHLLRFPESSIAHNTSAVYFLSCLPTTSYIIFHIQLPRHHIQLPQIERSSPRHENLMSFFLSILRIRLRENFKHARRAGSVFYLEPKGESTIEIFISGPSESIPTLLNHILKALANPVTLLSRRLFEELKVKRLQFFDNYNVDLSIDQKFSEFLDLNYHPPLEELNALRNITFEDVAKFASCSEELPDSLGTGYGPLDVEEIVHLPPAPTCFFHNAFIEGLIQGNYDETEARGIVENSIEVLGVKSVGIGYNENRILLVDREHKGPLRHRYHVVNPNKKERRNFVQLRMNVGTETVIHKGKHSLVDVHSKINHDLLLASCGAGGVLCRWLAHITRSMGTDYHPSATSKMTRSGSFVSFDVEGSYPLDALRSAVEQLVRDYLGTVDNPAPHFTEELLNEIRESIFSGLKRRKKWLNQEYHRFDLNSKAIWSRHYEFDYHSLKMERLRNLTSSEVRQFVGSELLGGPWLLIEVESSIPCNQTLEYKSKKWVEWETIENISEWRDKMDSMSFPPLPPQIQFVGMSNIISVLNNALQRFGGWK